MRANIWYNNYDVLRPRVDELKARFFERCKTLGLTPEGILGEFSQEIINRAVVESNWQEGIELDAGRTQELSNAAFEEVEEAVRPHLDLNKILRTHHDAVARLKRQQAAVEELAAYNLAMAHHVLKWIGYDLANHYSAVVAHLLRNIAKAVTESPGPQPEQLQGTIKRARELVAEMQASPIPLAFPMTPEIETRGQLISDLLKLDYEHLVDCMKPAYIHFLHKVVLMGILPLSKCGRYRTTSVHVGNPDVFFPVPAAVPKLMHGFCKDFPVVSWDNKRDMVLEAASASYRFVAIHPYVDGNGRVSRLLMNLVLALQFPPVYLKADRKGKHRYQQALHRANRGNIKPLACLIAMSLIEIFEKLNRSLNVRPAEQKSRSFEQL